MATAEYDDNRYLTEFTDLPVILLIVEFANSDGLDEASLYEPPLLDLHLFLSRLYIVHMI